MIQKSACTRLRLSTAATYLVISVCGLWYACCLSAQPQAEGHLPSGVRYYPSGPVVPPPQPAGYHRNERILSGEGVRNLGPLPHKKIEEADAAWARHYERIHPKPARVGLGRKLETAPMTLKDASVQHITRRDGTNVWLLAIRSPGAQGMRLHFKEFDVHHGCVLVYSEGTAGLVVRGPYSDSGPDHSGTFWTESLPGELVFIEATSGSTPSLSVDEIVHLDCLDCGEKGPLLDCNLDAVCWDSLTSQVVRDATVHLLYNVRVVDGQTLCSSGTGTLLEDLDGDTFVPYLLTAYHVLNNQADVDTLQITFFYESTFCGGPRADFSSLPTMRGGTLLGLNPTDGGNDMSFIRLKGTPVAGAVCAGWSTANHFDSHSYGIHHPRGNHKQVTFFDQSYYELCPEIDGGDDGDYFLADAYLGAIQPGSSGSGLFDSEGRLLGQLRGRCGPGLDEDRGNCATEDGWRAVYGKFRISYGIGQVGRWLEIGGTINVNQAYLGTELGTPTQPYRTVNSAYDLAWDGSRIKIKQGTYSEALPPTLTKKITLISDGPVTIKR